MFQHCISTWLVLWALWAFISCCGHFVKLSDEVFEEGQRRSPVAPSNDYLYTDSAIEATYEPSPFPSQFPVPVPSFFPSATPSQIPSQAPSQSPTQVVNYECVDLAGLSATASEKTIWFNNGFDNGYSGSTSGWLTFITQLQQLRLTTSPVEFIYITLSNDCFTPTAKKTSYPSLLPQSSSSVFVRAEPLFSAQRCQDRNAVSSMWTGVTNSRDFAISCGFNTWTGYSNGPKYLMSMNNTRKGDGSRYILGVTVRGNVLSWPEWSQKSTAGVNSITIDYNLSFPGWLYCAAYPVPAPVLSTSLSIWQARFKASVSASDNTLLSGTLTVSGLSPNTEYVAYCFTEGFWNDADSTERSPLSATLSAASTLKTAAPLESIVNVNVPFLSTIQGMTTAAISVSSSYLSSNISIIPRLSYLGPANCNANLDPSTLPLSSVLTGNDSSSIVAPQILLFNQLTSTRSRDLYIKTSLSGCYVLSFISIADMNSNGTAIRINVVSPAGLFSNMLLINSTRNPSYTFAATSARFSSDGLAIDVRFSDSTDRGAALRLPITFPCDRILNFTAASLSSCTFDRAFLLRAILPASEARLPVPGDSIVVLANSLKPACGLLPAGSDCSILDFIRETQLWLNGDDVKPTAIVAAPMQVAANQDLTLDISLSSGNGGRPWTTIRWAVASNYSMESGSFSTLSLQDLMNNGSMAWTFCVPDTYFCNRIPKAYLSNAGIYSFVLSLRNFAGKWASAAATVRVMSDPVPSVYIFGPSVSTLFTNQTTIIRSVVTTNEQACSTFGISWLVYENGILRQNLQSTNPRYKDSRTLVIDPYRLIPGSEYSISVLVMCGAFSSIDQVTRYISSCEVVASIRNGNSIFASLNNPIVFDASSSYMSCINRMANDTTFQWSCMQRSPLNDSGCNSFYTALKTLSATSSSLVFNNPEAIFVPGANYVISVKVSSALLRISDSVSQSLTILGKVDLLVPVVTIVEKQIVIDGSFRHTLDGYVSSSQSVLAEWALTTNNRTIVSRILYEGRTHYFPAVFPPSLVVGRSSFTFRLRAMTVTDSCNDFRCASPAVVSSSSMRIFINQPPMSGSLAVSPTAGFDDSQFTLAAQNWHDDNLPLFYTFHQSVFNPDLDFYLIRNRMQVPFVSTTLAVSGQKTNSIKLRLWVFDNLMAKAESFSAAEVYERVQNVTVMLNRVQASSGVVQQLLNPEILLPSLNSIISVSNNCTQGDAVFCSSIAETGSRALSVSVDKYNAGTSVLQGLSSYLKALAQLNSVDLMPSSASLIQVYNYLASSSRAVGFSVGDGSTLVDSLLESCDSLFGVLHLRDEVVASSTVLGAGARKLDVENSGEVMNSLAESVYALASDYFSAFPFGYTETIQSSNFFNVSIKKSYWDEVAETRYKFVLDKASSLSSSQFVSSVTAAYSALVVTNSASYYQSSGTNVTHVLHTKYLDFSLSSNNNVMSAILSLELPESLLEEQQAVVESLAFSNQTNSSAVVTLYRQCNDTEPVICSESMTRGPAYAFPEFICLGSNNSIVVYSCPLYNSSVLCFDNVAGAFYAISERAEGSFHCAFPLVLINSPAATDKQPSVSIKGSYSVARHYYELSPASQTETSKPTSKPVPPPTEDILANLSDDQKVSYLAIIGIGVAGIAFLAFIYNRVKAAESVGSNFDLVVPSTQASYVRPVTTVDLESVVVDTDETKLETSDELVVRDVECINFQAVAFPLAETRPTSRTTYYMPDIDVNQQYRAGGTFNLQDLYMGTTHGSRHGRRSAPSDDAV